MLGAGGIDDTGGLVSAFGLRGHSARQVCLSSTARACAHVIFAATDCTSEECREVVAGVIKRLAENGFTAEVLRGIERDNALALFPRLKGQAGGPLHRRPSPQRRSSIGNR